MDKAGITDVTDISLSFIERKKRVAKKFLYIK